MTKLVFLVEELSMVTLLEGLLPRFFPRLSFQCVPHNGKRDLLKSIPRKLRGWREPGVRFVVMRDQDQDDCRRVKENLTQACTTAGRSDALVRVVCRELEAWYIGEPSAAAQAFPERQRALMRELRKARYRVPDDVVAPARAFEQIVPEFQKRRGARQMAEFLTRRNSSRSFHAFLDGIERLQAAT